MGETIRLKKKKKIKDSNARPETIKLLEENRRGKLPDTGSGNDFLYFTSKGNSTKAKLSKQDHTKLKSFHSAKEAISKMKIQATKWQKILAHHVSISG